MQPSRLRQLSLSLRTLRLLGIILPSVVLVLLLSLVRMVLLELVVLLSQWIPIGHSRLQESWQIYLLLRFSKMENMITAIAFATISYSEIGYGIQRLFLIAGIRNYQKI